MYISKQLRDTNIAEYLIYMWQIEDQIRAAGLDLDKIKKSIIDKYDIDNKHKDELAQWYSNLIEMMRMENVAQCGHLQINKNVLANLVELNARLLASTKEPFYNAAYFKALPYIIELRQKSTGKNPADIEICFEALYGMLLLKLQKKEISEATQAAMKEITNLVSMLANYYNKEKRGELDLDA